MTNQSRRDCAACGKQASADASKCIHCGHPLQQGRHKWWTNLIGFVIFLAFLPSIIDSLTGNGGHPGLPSCSGGESAAQKAWGRNLLPQIFDAKIAAFTNAQTISESPYKVACKATVVLDSGLDVVLDYNFWTDASLPAGQYHIHSEIEPHSMKLDQAITRSLTGDYISSN